MGQNSVQIFIGVFFFEIYSSPLGLEEQESGT